MTSRSTKELLIIMESIRSFKLQKTIITLFTLFLITACGGSDSDEAITPVVKQGVFLDSPVGNLDYMTKSSAGIITREGLQTNIQGEYFYTEGEIVIFSIGPLEFPPVAAAGVVTPLDMAGTRDPNDAKAKNIIRLLQTLDKDGNPSNGIEVTPEAKVVANFVTNDNANVDIFGLSENEFAASVQTLIVNAAQDQSVTELVSTQQAISHFQDTLLVNNITFDSGDTAPPIISLTGESIVTIPQGGTYIDAGATATDNVDTNITVITENPVDTSTVASYTVRYTAQDAAGNNATAVTRTVNVLAQVVVDSTAPVITLIGDNPVTITEGDTYTDAGATATDNVDTNVTVITENPVDTSTVASYTVRYTAQDAAGNNAAAVTRTVNVIARVVVDTTPPVITLIGDNPVTITEGDTFTDAGATATDNVDSNVTVITENPVNTSTVASYIVRYTAQDAAGNNATTVTRTVNVVAQVVEDTAAPVITLIGDNPVTITEGDTYTDAGATATDNVDTNVTVITENPVNTSIVASYTVRYTAQDAAGNNATTVTRTVNVVAQVVEDTTAPIITLIGDNPVTITEGDTYTDAGATATDNVDTTVTVITENSVDTSTVASYIVRYTAQDAAGNNATAVTRTVNVLAEAVEDTYTVSTNSGANGSISPESASVNQGSNTTFTLTPSANYEIDTVTGCDGSLSGNTYTTDAISSACTVSVTFKTQAIGDLKISDVVFSDDNFKQCVVSSGKLFTDELTSLSCASRSITSVSGLEKLTTLTSLDLNYNDLTAIDVSKNTSLTYLRVSNNQLTAIDVTKNTALTSLSLADNQLTEIDITQNQMLTYLNLPKNQLTSIDISQNALLTSLSLSRNQLTTVDLSSNPSITELNLGSTVACTGSVCPFTSVDTGLDTGTGGCVNYPLPTVGLKVKTQYQNLSRGDHSDGTSSITTSYSTREELITEISSTSLSKETNAYYLQTSDDGSRWVFTTDEVSTDTFTIDNSIVEMTGAVSTSISTLTNTFINAPTKTTITTTDTTTSLSPAQRFPIGQICEGQTWDSSFAFTSTYTSTIETLPDGNVTPPESSDFSYSYSGNHIVEAVNVSKTTAAGTFNTFRFSGENGSYIDTNWVDIASGVTVFSQTKSASSNSLISSYEVIEMNR